MIELFDDTAATFDDPLGMLRACHRRIERALDVMDRIAGLEAAGPLEERSRSVLRQTLHYFATGVPRHAADEEASLFPRLRRAAERSGAVEKLQDEHAALDAGHRELDHLGQELLESGAFASPTRRERFRQLIALLKEIYAEHIRIEDEEVFPAAAQVLQGEQLEEVGAEMAARRGIDWSRQRQVVAQMARRRRQSRSAV